MQAEVCNSIHSPCVTSYGLVHYVLKFLFSDVQQFQGNFRLSANKFPLELGNEIFQGILGCMMISL